MATKSLEGKVHEAMNEFNEWGYEFEGKTPEVIAADLVTSKFLQGEDERKLIRYIKTWKEPAVYWSGVAEKCDICNTEFGNVMYDAKTKMGPWACMCETCFTGGPGLGRLGLGLGQKYEKQTDGRWMKVAG